MEKKKIPYIEYLPIILIGLVLFKLLDRIDSIYSLFLTLLGMFQPVFWAIGIAYALNPMMRFFERTLKIRRILSIILCYLIVFGLITAIITIVIPMIVDNVTELISNFEGYRKTGIDAFTGLHKLSPVFQRNVRCRPGI